MNIVGKHKYWMVWKCEAGFYHKGFLFSSGAACCQHCDGETYFDYLDVTKLVEITDENIINEIK
jgi:hypothetical protein